jgi:hypothetical protein
MPSIPSVSPNDCLHNGLHRDSEVAHVPSDLLADQRHHLQVAPQLMLDHDAVRTGGGPLAEPVDGGSLAR